MHTTATHTHIVFIMPRPKGIGSCHTHNNRCFNCKYSHSKRNELSSLVVPVPPPLNDSVINPPQLYQVFQQSSRSTHNTPCDNRCFNCRDSHSKRNELSSLVIPVPPPLNDSIINKPQLSSFHQQSSRSSQNPTPESQYSSIPGHTSADPSNTIPPPSTKNGSCNLIDAWCP